MLDADKGSDIICFHVYYLDIQGLFITDFAIAVGVKVGDHVSLKVLILEYDIIISTIYHALEWCDAVQFRTLDADIRCDGFENLSVISVYDERESSCVSLRRHHDEELRRSVGQFYAVTL